MRGIHLFRNERSHNSSDLEHPFTGKKNGFATAAKFGTADTILVAATKNFAAETKCLVDRTKHFVVVTKCFAIPILTNDFVSIIKPFFPFWFFL